MSLPSASPRLPLVAIVGNPNAGKTTLFNALTGSHQKVGNYPGVTVEKVHATIRLGDTTVECVDVPGLYSIAPVSEDEKVAAGVIQGIGDDRPDLLVCVVDAGNLERNLYFYSQLCDLNIPIVVALTMVDRVQKSGAELNLARLSNLLGTEVVPIVGHKGRGLDGLKDAIDRMIAEPRLTDCDLALPGEVDAKVAALRERFARIGADLSKSQVRKALLDPDEEMQVFLGNFPEMQEAVDEARKELGDHLRPGKEVASRYEWAGMVAKAALTAGEERRGKSRTDKIDRILTHRVFGLIIFLSLMYLVFQSIYSFASPLMDGIEWVFGELQGWVGPMLEGSPVLQSLVVDGIIAGVGGVLVFLPQILILFFFIAVLEGTGYLARAAFLMDRLLGWCGLNGRAFIPLLSSFACAIPGIMAARVMPDPKSRLATILVAPLMSCSARLPVYLLLIGAFIEPQFGPVWAGVALFGMHLVGLALAVPIAWFFNRRVIKGKRLPFMLELPPYQWPKWRDVWVAMYFRGKVFVKTAGTIIFAMSVLIWALLYFPQPSEAQAEAYRTEITRSNPAAEEAEIENHVASRQLENSYLGRFGKSIEPVFIPAGFDWRLTTGILAAFPARETVVPSMGILFSLGGEVDDQSVDLREALAKATWPDGRKLVTPYTAVGLMVFFALCCQCMATLATIKRETNSWKWPLIVFGYMTALAYIFAVLINQIGLALG